MTDRTRVEYVNHWRDHFGEMQWVAIDAGHEDRWIELRDGFDTMIEKAATTLYGEARRAIKFQFPRCPK